MIDLTNRKKYSGRFITVLLIALLLRLLLFFAILLFNTGGFIQADSHEYLNIAENVITKAAFSQSIEEPLIPDCRRTPVYPLFIALFRLAGFNLAAIIFIQLILSAFNCFLAFKITHWLTKNNKSSIFACLIVAIDIPTIVYANYLLTETLFTSLFLISIFFLVRYLKDDGEKVLILILSGIFLGLSILCRPISLFFPVVMVVLLLLFQSRNFKLFLIKIPLFLLAVIIPLSPWLLRNQILFGSPILSTISSTNMLHYRAAGVYAAKEKVSFTEAQRELKELAESTFQGNKDEHPLDYKKHEAKLGVSIIIANPFYYIKNNISSAFNLFLSPLRSTIDLQLGLANKATTLANWGKSKKDTIFSRLLATTSGFTLVMVLVQMITLAIVWLLAVAGMIAAFKNKNYLSFALLLLTILYFAVITGGPEAYARFRVPIMPFLALISGIGFSFLSDAFKKKPSQQQ